MNIKQSSTIIFAAAAFAAFSAIPAHAGAFADWFDDKFTFREEQKHLITPTSHAEIPPTHVISPHYDEPSAAEWSRYYTSSAPQPEFYLDASSKVMALPEPTYEKQKQENLQQAAKQQPQQQATGPQYAYMVPQGYTPYPPGYGAGNLPQGYQMFDWRAYANQLQQSQSNLYIGEPGTTPNNPLQDPTQVGRKMQIGEPVKPWDAQPRSFDSASIARAGDYNYSNQTAGDYREEMPQGGSVIANGMAAIGGATTQNMGNYPNSYKVQSGDTLSGISEQGQIYGDWKMWPLIYDANRNIISDPDLIRPEQNLGIPRNYSESEAIGARQRAINKRYPTSLYDGY